MPKNADEFLKLDDKTILVAGGTGSFGQHFVSTVLERWKPRKLIVLSHDKYKQFSMQQSPEGMIACPSSPATCATRTACGWRCGRSTTSSMPRPSSICRSRSTIL